MLSLVRRGEGDYDEALRRSCSSRAPRRRPAFGQLHARLLWCQVDADDLARFRDRVLVPALAGVRPARQADPTAPCSRIWRDWWRSCPNRRRPTRPPPTAWKKLMAALDKGGDKLPRTFNTRHAIAERERANPPPMIKKVNFCTPPRGDPVQRHGDVIGPGPARAAGSARCST